MKRAALLTLVLITASDPSFARTYHGHRLMAHTTHHASRVTEGQSPSHSAITCDMVRAYVAQVGLAQAAAMAESAGITSAEKERAKRCLAEKS